MSYLGTSTLKETGILNGSVETVTGVSNVSNQIKNLLEEDGDALGSYYDSAFINRFVNFPLTSGTALVVKNAISDAIRKRIPAVSRFEISYTINREEKAIEYLIIFVVKTNNVRESLVYPFYLR